MADKLIRVCGLLFAKSFDNAIEIVSAFLGDFSEVIPHFLNNRIAKHLNTFRFYHNSYYRKTKRKIVGK